MKSKEIFLRNVNSLIERAGVSKAELARVMGMKTSLLHRYLKGDNAPGLDMLDGFSDALGVTTPALIGDEATLAANPTPRIDAEVFIAKLEEVRLAVLQASGQVKPELLSPHERELLQLFRSLPLSEHGFILATVRAAATDRIEAITVKVGDHPGKRR